MIIGFSGVAVVNYFSNRQTVDTLQGGAGCGLSAGEMRARAQAAKRRMPNGKRIFLYGISRSGRPIKYRMDGMDHRSMPGMSCADCHGVNGRGGRISMMMGTFKAPNITADELREEGFTKATIGRAIVKGVDEKGGRLKFPMPKWSMSASDLDDLVSYMRNLR